MKQIVITHDRDYQLSADHVKWLKENGIPANRYSFINDRTNPTLIACVSAIGTPSAEIVAKAQQLLDAVDRLDIEHDIEAVQINTMCINAPEMRDVLKNIAEHEGSPLSKMAKKLCHYWALLEEYNKFLVEHNLDRWMDTFRHRQIFDIVEYDEERYDAKVVSDSGFYHGEYYYFEDIILYPHNAQENKRILRNPHS